MKAIWLDIHESYLMPEMDVPIEGYINYQIMQDGMGFDGGIGTQAGLFTDAELYYTYA